jgi:hypothetical protein
MFYPTTTSLARPNNAQTGQIFFDTTINGLIIWDGTKWIELTNPISFALNALTRTTDGQYGAGGQIGGGGIYSKGSQVTLTATADQHYSFVGWAGDLTELAQPLERITTVNMTDSFNIFAEFAIESYTLTLQAGPNGEIVSGSGSYPYSTYAEIEAQPDFGYDFTGWSSSIPSSVVDISSAKTQVFVDADMNITASFQLKPYEIFTNIFGSGDVQIQDTATYNSQVVISRQPSPGYDNNNALTKVRDRSGTLIEVFTKDDGRQFFNMPNSDVFIDVFFDAIQYTVTDSSDNNVNLSVTKTSAIVDDKIYFSVNFERGYEIDGVISATTSDGTTITLTAEDDQGINFSFIMPAQPVFLNVSSSLVDYGITLTHEPANTSILNARFQNLSEYTLDPQGFTTEGSYNQKVFIDIQESEGFKLKSFTGQKDNGGLLSVFGLHNPGIHEYGLNIDYNFHKQYDPSVPLAKDDLNNVFFYMPEDSVTINGVFEEHKYVSRVENIPNSYSFSSTFNVDDASTTFTYKPYTNHKFFAFSCYGNTGSIDKDITLKVEISNSITSFSLSSEADLYNNRFIQLNIPAGKTMGELSTFLSSETVYGFSLDTNLSTDFPFTSGIYTLQGAIESYEFSDIDISDTENFLGDEVIITLTPEDGHEMIVGDFNVTRMDNGQSIEFDLTSDVFTSVITFNTPSAGTLLGYSMIESLYTIEIVDSGESNNGLTEIETDNLEVLGDSISANFEQIIELTSTPDENYELIEYQSYYINPKDTSETQNEFYIDISNLDSISLTMPAGNVFITPVYLGKESNISYIYNTSETNISPDIATSARFSDTVSISKTNIIPESGYDLASIIVHKYEPDIQQYPLNKGDVLFTFDDLGQLDDDAIITFTMPEYDIVIDIKMLARPISNFIVSPDEPYYFGNTIELTDISTAPSGDGTIVSSVYTNNAGVEFSSVDTAVRFFFQQDMYIELDNVGDNIFNFNEEFSILYYGDQFSLKDTPGHDTFSRGHFALGGYEGGFNQLLHYIVDPTGASKTNYRCAGTNMPKVSKTVNGYLNKGHVFRHDPNTGTYGTFDMRGLDPFGAITLYSYGLETGYHAPPSFVEDSVDASTHKFIIGKIPIEFTDGRLGLGPCPVLYRDMLFINRRITDAEVDEFLAMDPGTYDQLSYYSEVVDWVEFGAQLYPNITGRKGVVSGSLKGSAITESNFQSILSLDLPIGSTGDTTGSINVTLTVTDDQGLTEEFTKTLEYGLAPLEEPEITSLEKFVITTDGLNILGAPSVTSLETEIIDDSGATIVTNKLL